MLDSISNSAKICLCLFEQRRISVTHQFYNCFLISLILFFLSLHTPPLRFRIISRWNDARVFSRQNSLIIFNLYLGLTKTLFCCIVFLKYWVFIWRGLKDLVSLVGCWFFLFLVCCFLLVGVWMWLVTETAVTVLWPPKCKWKLNLLIRIMCILCLLFMRMRSKKRSIRFKHFFAFSFFLLFFLFGCNRFYIWCGEWVFWSLIFMQNFCLWLFKIQKILIMSSNNKRVSVYNT